MAQLIEENIDGVIVFHISGSLTVTALQQVETRFNALAAEKAARLVADIAEVDAITTPAVSLILKTARAVEKRGGMMVFANATPAVRGLFACCRLDMVLSFFSSSATAMKLVRCASN